MFDRKYVIEALENCSAPDGKCKNCPYVQCESFECSKSKYPDDLVREAIKLLKEQEPRVLTLDEIKKLQSLRDGAVWLEVWRGVAFPALPEILLSNITYFVAIPFNHYRSWVEDEYYGKTWRCWSSRPTKQQMEAVKWDD